MKNKSRNELQSSYPRPSQRWLPAAVFLVSGSVLLFLVWGLPYWDDDYRHWLTPASAASWPSVLLAWISPVSVVTADWGFVDRPFQMLCFKLAYTIAGLNSAPLLVFKSVAAGGAVTMIYLWSLKLARSVPIAMVSALFYLTAPALTAAQVWICDFGAVSQFLFLFLAYLWWGQIESVNVDEATVQKRWLTSSAALTAATYLAFRCKADLKLLPPLIFTFLLVADRRKLAVMAPWLVALFFGSVPWSATGLSSVPPFLPGGLQSSNGWVWQRPSLGHVLELFWSQDLAPWTLEDSWTVATVPLSSLLWPILLFPGLIILVVGSLQIARQPTCRPRPREAVFIALWLMLMILGASALAPLPKFFRIRYGILLLAPLSIAAGAWLRAAWSIIENKRWRAVIGTLLATSLFGQLSLNMRRGIDYREKFGQMVTAVDKIYHAIDAPNSGAQTVALVGGFLPYAPWPGANHALAKPVSLGSALDLICGPERFTAGATLAVSWSPVMAPGMEFVGSFDGCHDGSLFERLIPCHIDEARVYLYRYRGVDPSGIASQCRQYAR